MILELKASLKSYLWGGNKLSKIYEVDKSVAEAWILSTHEEGPSIILNGEYSGKGLDVYIKDKGKKVLGEKAKSNNLDIMIKLIDAKRDLSIQVHPQKDYKNNLEGMGKNEMWYILDCDEDAQIIYGLNQSISKDELRKLINENRILEVLNIEKVNKGEAFYVPSGTIHGIRKGNLIFEAQQNSNTTYRIYDYNRKDDEGNLRDLHIEDAINVANTEPTKNLLKNNYNEETNIIAKNEYFTVSKLEVLDKKEFDTNTQSFASIFVKEGKGKIISKNSEINLSKGSSIFVPANNDKYEIIGNLELLITNL